MINEKNDLTNRHAKDDKVDSLAAVVIILAITAGVLYWLWTMPS